MTLFTTGDGNTPLSSEEQADLIPNLSTKEELNEWERQNILEANIWALDTKRFSLRNPLTEPFVRDLHRRMFDETWRWAGKYRTSEKNIGIFHHQIRNELPKLLGDVQYWIENHTFGHDEISIRLHHRLVFIHPFPNGNGRHARLMSDVLCQKQGRPLFTWGGAKADIMLPGAIRDRYLAALRAADKQEIQPLLEFARS
jgi:Fic-DOC domain mobile mystery protein B